MGKVIVRGEEVRNKAIEIVARGGSFQDASEATGFGVDYVRHLCTRAGVHKPRFKKDKERERKALEMIEAGYSAIEIAQALNYGSESSIYGLCKRHGIKIRAKVSRNETIIELRNQQMSMASIAKRLNISVNIVSAVCRKEGVDTKRIDTKTYWGACKRCGKPYFGLRPNQKYCSHECEKSASWARNDVVRRKNFNDVAIDRDITLEKVYERNHGICYLCGKKCDYSDYVMRNGKRCARKNYPSIEHVIPISLGGTHTWDNVKLSCISCNAKKGVKTL